MLEPSNRRLLLEALRPPPGFGLDLAVGTTFTLDLHTLLTAPLAFAMFDWENEEADPSGNVIASLEAVRRYADRIHLFCQAGEIAVPLSKYRPLVSYLENSVHQVRMPAGAIFHPKVWMLRFRRTGDQAVAYRLLCLSRNLTFDRSWDTVLSLDGSPTATAVSENLPLREFLITLPSLSEESTSDAASEISELAEELRQVRFVPPPGFDTVAFQPLGLPGSEWPFERRLERLFVISPFLTAGTVKRLGGGTNVGTLVSRPESLDAVGGRGLSSFETLYVLASDSMPVEESEDETSVEETSVAETVVSSPGVELTGLHTKLYVGEAGESGYVWSGSANATDAAVNANIEFLVQMQGPRDTCGVEAFIGSKNKEVGLLDLLTPYTPVEDPEPLSAEEESLILLEEAARALASLHFIGRVKSSGYEHYLLSLESEEELPPELMSGISGRCWPITLKQATASQPLPVEGRLELQFGERSFDAMTSFFAFELTSKAAWPRRFVVNASLIGAPEDRRERILASLLENAEDFLNYLRFLLADLEDAQGLLESLNLEGGAGEWGRSSSSAVLEPLLRALNRDPSRLDHIARLITDLSKTPDGLERLPAGFNEVWEPIWKVRQGLVP